MKTFAAVAAILSGAALLAAADTPKEATAAQKAQSSNNLKQILLALHNYNAVYGKFPPAAICDTAGKPLLSWRVALLPYLEQDNLYKQFKLTEAWDSPANKALAATRIKLFELPGAMGEPAGTTHYRSFVGKGAAFDLKEGVRLPQFTDGTSNTIVVAEATEGVPWAKPDDIEYDPAMTPKLGYFADGYNVAFADGSVKRLKKTIDPKILHALITRAGGEVIPRDFDK